MTNRSHRYDINRPRPTHGHKYKIYLSILMDICIKQHLTNITFGAQFIKKLSNKEAELKKSIAYKKKCRPIRTQNM